ncbi:MAG: type II secretion system protein [Armatimonadetes bacterium]|nr:type II secretion system protein [Armatimonadota bacterium]
MRRSRTRAFTLIEILVSIAILVILFGLMLRPVMMGMEVLSIGRGEQQSQQIARAVTEEVGDDLQGALLVYPNLATYDLVEGPAGDAGSRWRRPQTARLDLVLPARDQNGRVLTPVRPAFANKDPRRPLVVTYWRMRHDPTIDYDPQANPYRLYRSIHSYDVSANPAVASPDQLYPYALEVARQNSIDLTAVGGSTELRNLFARGGPFDWFIYDIERRAYDSVDRIMRAPSAAATFSNAADMAAVSAVTSLDSDLRLLEFVPTLSENEELQANAERSAYQARLGRWVQPYQRDTLSSTDEAVWVMPANGLVPRSDGNGLPVVATFRAQGTRSGLLAAEYFIAVESSGTRAGHPILYRLPDSGDPVAVYDLTEYPRRVFRARPGEAMSAEFACGIDWESGQLKTVFSQVDVICPDPAFAVSRIHAANDPHSTAATTLPLYLAGVSSADSVWQSLPLTHKDAAGNELNGTNGAQLDEFINDRSGGAAGLWQSFTLSVFRPDRLRTDTALFPAAAQADRSLNMSVVPNSEQVVVEQYQVGSYGELAGEAPVARRVYTPLRALTGGAVNAGDLAPFRYYLDPTRGRLLFYDPQLDQDNSDPNKRVRDGLNPPAVVAAPDGSGELLVPVITVSYRYRNNLPTIAALQLGDDSTRDVVEATYRSLQAIELRMVLDVPTESTRGDDDASDPEAQWNAGSGRFEIVDPRRDPANPIDRPTGARKRISTATVLRVGSKL